MDYPEDFEPDDSRFDLDMDAALLADPLSRIEQEYEAKLKRGVSRDVAWQEKIEALQELLGGGDEA